MKRLLVVVLFCYGSLSHAQTNHLVISQVYGAGGNAGAPYTNDFVELYNPTGNAISLAGWSLQYAGATTNNWSSNKVDLTGSVQPGKYFLIQLSGSTNNGIGLPKPDFSSPSITISATAGKVALLNNTITLIDSCPTSSAIVDFVGYGTAKCYEGAVGPATSITTSIVRNDNGCMDNNNNSTDFVSTVVSPRNSASHGHTCIGTSIQITEVNKQPFCVDGTNKASGTISFSATGTFSNTVFTVALSDTIGNFANPVIVGAATFSGTNPYGIINIQIPENSYSSANYRLRIETDMPMLTGSQSKAVEIINGAKNVSYFFAAANTGQETLRWVNPGGCYDEIMIVAKESAFTTISPQGDGSLYNANLDYKGNSTTFDGGKVVYKGIASAQTVTGLTDGTRYYFKAFTRRGNFWSKGIEINDAPRIVALPGEIVINQLSPEFGATTDEYVELVNLTDKTFNLSDILLKFANSTGNNVVAGGTLSGTLQPHSYFLIANTNLSSITVGKTTAIIPDLNIDLGFAATSQQVGLLRKTDSTLIDAVSYGSISNPVYTEGASIANPPKPGGLQRIIEGGDKNNTTTDFKAVQAIDIDLRNSKSRLANNNAIINSGSYSRMYVTGNAVISGEIALSEKLVLTNGILSLNNYSLSTNAITGGTTSAYVKTTGSGALSITYIDAGSKLFPVGNSTYNPVTISNGNNLSWRVSVADGVPGTVPFDKNAAVQRTWNITPASTPAAGATIVFEYNDNDAQQVGASFNKNADIQIWNEHNSWVKAGDAMPVATANGTKAVTLYNYTNFSPFVLTNNFSAIVLPVNFINFKAKQQAGGIGIAFTNATEKDVVEYVVERSADGQNFVPQTTLKAQENKGTEVTYNWLDNLPLSADNFYRIKGMETSGKIIYSTILRVSAARKIKELTVYPNPVRNKQVVWEASLPQGAYVLRINNSNGQQIHAQNFQYTGGNYSQTINLPASIKPGVYTLQVINGNFFKQLSFVVL